MYTFIFSESGLLERMKLSSRYLELQQKIVQLKKSNVELEQICSRYREGDYSEREIVSSGLIYSGSKVIVFGDNYALKNPIPDDSPDNFELDPSHMRIIWIIISLMILIYYLNRIRNRNEALNG
jgi:hypothetical protein